MITIEYLYVFAGLIFAALAVLSAADRANSKRFGNAAFWGLFAVSFLFGSHLTDFENGVLVLALVIVGGFNFIGKTAPQTTTPDKRHASAARYGNGLFAVMLIVPFSALIGTVLFKNSGWFDPQNVTVIWLVLLGSTPFLVRMLFRIAVDVGSP